MSIVFDMDMGRKLLDIEELLKRERTIRETLTIAQGRCTELLEETRTLKRERGELMQLVIALRADLEEQRNKNVELHAMIEDASLEIEQELKRARDKHPPCERERFMVALMEEVGELAKEILEGGTEERIRAEASQVAVVAIRIMEDATDGAAYKAVIAEGVSALQLRIDEYESRKVNQSDERKD